mgnify:CR=1 FL=1
MQPKISKTLEGIIARSAFNTTKAGMTHSLKDFLTLELLREEGSLAYQLLSSRLKDWELYQVRLRIEREVISAKQQETRSPEEYYRDFTEELLAMPGVARSVSTAHALLAIISDRSTATARVLEMYGVTADSVSGDLQKFAVGDDFRTEVQVHMLDFGEENRNEEKGPAHLLDKFGVNLTRLAREGKIDPIIGREQEIERVVQILSRRKKNNPILIGEAGVGKSAIVEGLALRIARGEVPYTIADKTLFSLDVSSLVAGTKFRGEFEERMQQLLDELRKAKDTIIFIDEIHTIVGAGSADGALGASDMLKPMLARGELQTIGATTTDEYRKYIEKDAALERRFQPIQVHEPTIAETIEILKGLRSRYENHHHVTITDGALQSAAELSSRYIQDRNLPDKAIDLIDEAGARLRIKRLTAPPELKELDEKIAKIAADPEDLDVRRVELELWKKIREMARKGRRTGLGITAEGDMLAALGLRYGTQEAIDFAVEVQKCLALAAYGASVKMAAERGAFPVYDAAKEVNNPMIARIREADPALYEEMTKVGRRNIAMLTIAPTGTTSLMSQTTSGIEPVFRTVYKRRRKINPSDVDTHVDYEDETGEKFQEYNVYHHNFVKWLEASGYDTSKLATISDAELNEWVAASPYHGATANDIDWVAKVKMQGAIQKWVDHSISVTVNLPNNVSEALVADVYRTAWECGCKGVTVYRDGCRDGVLLEKNSKSRKKCEEHPGEVQKRPKSIPADIVRFKNGTEDWIAFVGLQGGRPYEVFTGKIEEDAMFIPPKIKKGFIIKVREADGTKRYDFQYTDRYGYTNTIGGISRLFNEEFWNYAKLISGVLRHGMPIEKTVSLIESLHLDSESINTWKTGVCRALKQYIVDGTKSKGKCPSCGQENMAYQNGCLTCMSCGYSKCG